MFSWYLQFVILLQSIENTFVSDGDRSSSLPVACRNGILAIYQENEFLIQVVVILCGIKLSISKVPFSSVLP